MNSKVSIIILNWNGWKDTIECLESLYQITYPNYDVIVVDNGSEDDSVEKMKEYAEGKIRVESKFFEYVPSNKPIKCIEYTREEAEAGGGKEDEIVDLASNRKMILIKNEKNYGFAEGANIGMRYALNVLNPDYILFLNNDTVVDRGFLDELVSVGETNTEIGIVGPKIYLYDMPEKVQSAGVMMNYWIVEVPSVFPTRKPREQEIRKVDYVSGCCMLIKSEVIEKIGILDPDYFCYYEETDFCVRAKKAGYQVVSTINAKIWHKLAVSSSKIPGFYMYYANRNTFRFAFKNLKTAQIITFLLWYSIVLFPITIASCLLKHRSACILKAYLRALKDVIVGRWGYVEV
ncbi:MAG: glycosyltransferase family 2 protein [Candidatus Marinimicrobia bacterium]|nr:glycosyltransferase family 2 protein [Candidatus Neomarinimicrobiota bacterium]